MSHIPAEYLALYASGDMEIKTLRGVEEHLSKCGECRESLAEFQGDLATLRALWTEPNTDELAELRRGVIERLQKKRKFALPWAWVGASLAATLGVAGIMLIRPPHQPEGKTYQALAIATYLRVPYRTRADISIPNLAKGVVRSRTAPPSEPGGIRSVTLLAEQDGPRILKMTTADPNVVILWQLGERTDNHD